MTTSVAVAVITFRRPQLLSALLASLAEQRLDTDRYTVRVVVVDNDPGASAAEVVRQAASQASFPVTYEVEPEPGIPAARQRSVDLCPGDDAVIFVDDDETCPPGWFATVLEFWRNTDADVVTGPVHGILPEQAPGWAHDADVHSSRGKWRTGQTLNRAYTNNTLVTRRVLDDIHPAFDDRFRFTGSSDLHFFRRVHRAGFTILWCNEAEVHETVPLERTSWSWMARRAFRSGAGDTISRRIIHPGPLSVLTSVLYAAGRVTSGLALILSGVIPARRAARVKGVRRICSGVGSLAGVVGLNYQEYRREEVPER